MNISNIIPNSLESEQSILGSIVIDKLCINSVVEIVREEHFYSRANAGIYKSMLEMIGSKKPIDLITLTDHMERKDILEDCGGFIYNHVDFQKILLSMSPVLPMGRLSPSGSSQMAPGGAASTKVETFCLARTV